MKTKLKTTALWTSVVLGILISTGATAGVNKLRVVPGEAQPQYGDPIDYTEVLRPKHPRRSGYDESRDHEDSHDREEDDESRNSNVTSDRSPYRSREIDGDDADGAIGVAAIPTSALIVYDDPEGVGGRKLGRVYAIMLRNLLGHFSLTVDMLPSDDYESGRIESYGAVFYLGSSYDAPLPSDFLRDVTTTTKQVVWFRYNIWQLAWNADYGFTTKTGLEFVALRGLNATPTPDTPAPGFFDDVAYKNKSFIKYYSYDTAANTINADPDIGELRVVDSTKAVVSSTIRNTATGESLPYVVKAGNFWYVADMPFSYIGPRDRYLAIADLLHDMLGIPHTENHRAMVRLEDLNALTVTNTVKQLADYLSSKKIPFGLAVTPYYRDPLGVYNGGTAMEVHLASATNLRTALTYAKGKGGQFVLHGYTHQYNSRPNPYSAVTSEDFEFWDIVNNAVLPEDSLAWAQSRITNGRSEMISSGYTPYVWETPHYQASPNAYAAVTGRFTARYERSVYYTATTPRLNLPSADPNRDFLAGQFFPYLIVKDHYGHRVLPENIGNIEYDLSEFDPTSNLVYTWQDLKMNAEYALVVRDGFASFFFHPYLLEPELGVPGLADFKSLVTAITGMGYKWIGAQTLMTETPK